MNVARSSKYCKLTVRNSKTKMIYFSILTFIYWNSFIIMVGSQQADVYVDFASLSTYWIFIII